MDERLTWKEHISDICTKAIKAKAFLRCNFYCPCSLTKNPIAIHDNTSFSEAITRIYCKSLVPTLTISEKVPLVSLTIITAVLASCFNARK